MNDTPKALALSISRKALLGQPIKIHAMNGVFFKALISELGRLSK